MTVFTTPFKRPIVFPRDSVYKRSKDETLRKSLKVDQSNNWRNHMHKINKDIISYEELYNTERGANALLVSCASACGC